MSKDDPMLSETTTLEKVMAAPILTLAGVTLFGYRVDELFQIFGVFWAAMASFAACIYTFMMIYFRLRKEYTKWKTKALEEIDSEI